MKMKILHLSFSDTEGGAARAAYRLHRGLLKLGENSTLLVQQKNSGDATVIGDESQLQHLKNVSGPWLDRVITKIHRKKEKILFSPAWLPGNKRKKIKAIDPDIIHLHWICNGFLRPETVGSFKRTIIWTLHDMWPFTGGCHYDGKCGQYAISCGMCPRLGSRRENDLSRWILSRKEKAWRDLDLSIVSPSFWLARCAQRSSLFKGRPIRVIKNGLDLFLYKPIDKSVCRDIWGLPQNVKLILCGAMSPMTERRKGYQLLQKVLRRFSRSEPGGETEMIVFGQQHSGFSRDWGIDIRFVGRLHDDVSICLLYGAADVFIAPSLQENLSNMVVEALSCGTPCVAFEIGGMPDMIEHKRCGYLAQPYDSDDFANGISWILKDEERLSNLSRFAREKAEKEFSVEKMALDYYKLYLDMLSRS